MVPLFPYRMGIKIVTDTVMRTRVTTIVLEVDLKRKTSTIRTWVTTHNVCSISFSLALQKALSRTLYLYIKVKHAPEFKIPSSVCLYTAYAQTTLCIVTISV